MYGNLIKTFVVTTTWLAILFAAPSALAVPKSILEAQNSANSAGSKAVTEWNARIKTQNDAINQYLNSSEGKSDTTAQQQASQLQASGGVSATSTASTLNTNTNSAATNWNQNNSGTVSTTATGTASAGSTNTAGMSQQQLLNRQVAKTQEDATKVAMDCATEFTQSVDALTKNNVIGGVPGIVRQYLGMQQIMTAAQLCSWLLTSFNLSRQAQVVAAAAAGQPLAPRGAQQPGQGMYDPATAQPDWSAVQQQLNTNVQAFYQQQLQAQAEAQKQAIALAEQARQEKEDQALMYMLLNGFGSGNGQEADPILMNMLFQ